ncbi:MAG: UDP-2,4-diacetamido-2,4,6-trideoxy-beta-L-altropyranose hydrolase [Eubacterium sp.]|nr:UDP-2,4-diacetamido-2,4,6-trideoxy-beta-L-altropyranose hydrolase [Eubacterium sp.]
METGKAMEIGSIFELNPDLVGDGAAQTAGVCRLEETEKYGKKNIRFTSSGREAIALALRSFEREKPNTCRRCLLPAYMCDSVFFPFVRAGWELYFYHLDRSLEVDGEAVDGLIGRIEPALILVHPYYGVDTWRSARIFLHRWRERGVCVMEDVTQSYYLQGAGVEADYCVGSLRKWYAVPDGGFVASDWALPAEKLAPNEAFVRERKALLQDKWKYLHGQMTPEAGRALKADYLRRNRETERWLDSYAGISAMSAETGAILSQTKEKECADRRRENCAYLHERIGERRQVASVFVSMDEKTDAGAGNGSADGAAASDDGQIQNAAPLYYPVYVADRDDLQAYLAQRGVYAPTLWQVGEENAAYLTQEERYIYEHILALPIDQRYDRADMQRVLELLDQYEVEQKTTACTIEKPERISAVEPRREGQTIGIRVDANDTIATGHVMRCITIAKQLVQAGSRVIFYTADQYAAELLTQANMEYVCLYTQWDDMEQEIPVLREQLIQACCDKLLVDSYRATAHYFEGLRDLCRLAYIDDCFAEVYPVDLLMNYNAYHTRFPYQSVYAGKAKLLLGTAYVPLREEFSDRSIDTEPCRETASRDVTLAATCGDLSRDHGAAPHVLISSGGGDLHHAMAGILRAAMQDETLRQAVFHVVMGAFCRDVDELRQLAKEYPNIRLHERVDHMARLMRGCRAAVSAAGTMLFELSATQTPTVFFVSADNQQYDHEFFAQDGRMLYGGDIRGDRDGCIGKICAQLRRLLEDEALRTDMRRKLHEVTDGNGAGRIAVELLRL